VGPRTLARLRQASKNTPGAHQPSITTYPPCRCVVTVHGPPVDPRHGAGDMIASSARCCTVFRVATVSIATGTALPHTGCCVCGLLARAGAKSETVQMWARRCESKCGAAPCRPCAACLAPWRPRRSQRSHMERLAANLRPPPFSSPRPRGRCTMADVLHILLAIFLPPVEGELSLRCVWMGALGTRGNGRVGFKGEHWPVATCARQSPAPPHAVACCGAWVHAQCF
jgi:hypothetical protein